MIIRDRQVIAQIRIMAGISEKQVLRSEIKQIEEERKQKNCLTFGTKGSK